MSRPSGHSRHPRAATSSSAASWTATTAALAGCGDPEVVTEVVEKVVTVEVPSEPKVVTVEVPGEAGETRVVTILVEGEAAQPVTQVTNVWFNQATQQANFEKHVVGHYHRQQSAYRLDPILVPNNELTVKLTAAIAGGNPPDALRSRWWTAALAGCGDPDYPERVVTRSSAAASCTSWTSSNRTSRALILSRRLPD